MVMLLEEQCPINEMEQQWSISRITDKLIAVVCPLDIKRLRPTPFQEMNKKKLGDKIALWQMSLMRHTNRQVDRVFAWMLGWRVLKKSYRSDLETISYCTMVGLD